MSWRHPKPKLERLPPGEPVMPGWVSEKYLKALGIDPWTLPDFVERDYRWGGRGWSQWRFTLYKVGDVDQLARMLTAAKVEKALLADQPPQDRGTPLEDM